MPLPAEVLAATLRADPGRPRVTAYDDGTGERIELSAKVLATWVSKAANLLQDDADAGPGRAVGLDLPAHWRACYWALAVWSVGATLALGRSARAAEILVTDSPARAADASGYAVLVTPAALARFNPDTPPGVVDEARELATYGDRFDPYAAPAPASRALDPGDGRPGPAYRDVVDPARARDWGPHPRVLLTGDLHRQLLDALAAWAADGSVVMIRGGGDGASVDQTARLDAERVTVRLT
ncbi:MAG: TIGR03089 family protein [Dermatophilaceae bacterium]